MSRSFRLAAFVCLVSAGLAACDKSVESDKSAAAAAPAPLASDAQRSGYALGVTMGRQFRMQGLEVDGESLSRGLRDAYTEQALALNDGEIDTAMQNLQKAHQEKMKVAEEKRQSEQQEVAVRNKAEADAFFAQNRTAEGVVTTESGLQYKVEKMGDGPKPAASDTVKVHYRGTLRDGTEFDSSYARGEPVSFPVNAVIGGWVEALQLMPVGSKWHLYIPSDLAYGPGGAGDRIGPNAMLEFDVELLAIEPPAPSADGE
jgi:FKBP-type peptidyl-prolyl cis-trans isomerase